MLEWNFLELSHAATFNVYQMKIALLLHKMALSNQKMPGGVGSTTCKKFDFKGLNKFTEKYNKELGLYVEVSNNNE